MSRNAECVSLNPDSSLAFLSNQLWCLVEKISWFTENGIFLNRWGRLAGLLGQSLLWATQSQTPMIPIQCRLSFRKNSWVVDRSKWKWFLLHKWSWWNKPTLFYCIAPHTPCTHVVCYIFIDYMIFFLYCFDFFIFICWGYLFLL